MISSFFEGRIRINRPELKNSEVMEMVLGFVRSQEGILTLTPNTRTGSLIITYDPKKIPQETLEQAATLLAQQLDAQKPATSKKSGRRGVPLAPFGLSLLAETVILASVYGVIALTGFTNPRLHIVGGLLFTGLLADHVYRRRKFLE